MPKNEPPICKQGMDFKGHAEEEWRLHNRRLHTAYSEAAAELRGAIRTAKSKAWDELVDTVAADLWDRSYKVVLGKIHPKAPPVTESMEEAALENILTTLSPPDEWEIRRSEEREKEDALDAQTPPPGVTTEEIAAAVKRMGAHFIAPGPEGIPGKAIAIASNVIYEDLKRMFDACLRQGRFPRLQPLP